MFEDRRNPPGVDVLVTDAMQAVQAGKFDTAEALCRRALSQQAGSMRAYAALGAVFHAKGAHTEAAKIFEELAERQPREATHWMNLGTVNRALTRYDEALAAYSRAAQLGYLNADFYFNVGLTHLDRRDYESARAVLKRAHELAPEDSMIRFQYVTACYESMQMEEAVAALQGWTDFSALNAQAMAELGHRLMNLGQADRAEAAVRQLPAAEQLEPGAALTLIQILERTNRIEEARAALDRLLADPRASALGADLVLANALINQRESRHDTAIELFQEALAQTPALSERHHVLFPLAKSLEAAQRYAEAFAASTQAHVSQIEHLKQAAPLAVARGAPTMQITRYSCDPADVAQWQDSTAPDANDSPIFVVAFPRSGTTLLEQSLDAHPALCSMDEQPLVQNALDDLIACGATYPERLATLTASQLASVRGRYFERAASRVSLQPGQRLVDKNPLNLLRLPVIRRVFPNARILLAIRHPCDVVVSCFMQHFRAPEFALLCADLNTLAVGYGSSFDFWYQQVEILQPAVLEVRYEQLVADFEQGMRRIAAFLDLPWDDALLAPAERARVKGFISTPSYAQVVQPVSQKAVGRWRRYEQELAPIIRQLEPYLRRWDYSATS